MLRHAAIGRSTGAFNPHDTLTITVKISRSNWLVAGVLPGVERRPLKKLKVGEGARHVA